MRILSLDESIEKVKEKSFEVEISDKRFYLNSINLFWNFLASQPRLNNLLVRIENEYFYIDQHLVDLSDNSKIYRVGKFFLELEIDEKRGAFGFFIIKRIKSENWTTAYDLIGRVFQASLDYEDSKARFNELIFKPFVNLLIDLLEESKTDNIVDYFSKKEVKETEARIDKILEELEELSLGHEVLFEELQDLKEQLSVLNKKNWVQLMKGKLMDAYVIEISKEAIKFVYKGLTGHDFPLLS